MEAVIVAAAVIVVVVEIMSYCVPFWALKIPGSILQTSNYYKTRYRFPTNSFLTYVSDEQSTAAAAAAAATSITIAIAMDYTHKNATDLVSSKNRIIDCIKNFICTVFPIYFEIQKLSLAFLFITVN